MLAPLTLCLLLLGQDASLERRRQALEIILKVLPPSNPRITGRISPHDKTWEDWVRRTGELPPDFDRMPSIPALPDPLVLVEGGRAIPVTTPAQWARRRAWIRAQFERWVYGKMPPRPDNLRGEATAERTEGGARVRDVLLRFGPGGAGRLRVQLIYPSGPGPFPVFLTNHPRTRPWVNTAVRRGYLGCIYFAADPIYGHDDDSDKFLELYPDYDFSCLARWAWAAMRAVDYLYTLPEVDRARIGIAGHSRNGKQALLAAAFDERIGAVVPSSGNTGEGNPWRYTTDMFVNESIEEITGSFPHWFHPRLRFFAGREHKLPVDQNSLMALVAPRGLLMYSAFSEAQGAPWGFEQAYRSVRRVYEFLGHPEKVGLHLRPGEHPTTAGDVERFLDFFDSVFGRKAFPRPETFIHGYTFEAWRQLSADTGRYPPASAGLRERIQWALGEEPAGVRFPAASRLGEAVRTSDGWLGGLYNRPLAAAGMASAALAFGDDLKADLYHPAAGKGKWPVVVWLHPYSYATGYSRYTRPAFESLVKRGFAVLAFDQIGFGARVTDARDFYRRYPRWSLMGKMVADTRAALDALASLDSIDASRIFLAGYALGAKVGLFTAVLDSRVAAIASACGFTPLRLATADKGIEGIRQDSYLHGLIPRFGFFVDGRERLLPVDYDDLLAAIAPRPVYVLAPALDRYAPVGDVRRAVETARKLHPAITLETPLDFNRFPRQAQERVFDWLAALR